MPKARILAVDDQRYFRELLEGLLRDEGYEVEAVASADQALQALERGGFDVVVTDLVMPGVDGSELVRQIVQRMPDQEIVMVTGVIDVRTAVAAMQQGAADYILKPFDRDSLVSSLDRVLERRRLRDEHARLMTENLEIMSVLAFYERACGLFADLALEPLAERLLEGLCLATHAQGGVLWIAEGLESTRLLLSAARGIVEVEREAPELSAEDLGADFAPDSGQLAGERQGDALYVPLHSGARPIGLARLSDPLAGSHFGARERSAAERFAAHGARAVVNALRFRAVEHSALRDPTTQVYSQAFFRDAARSEIDKARRLGRSFSLIQVDVGPLAARPQVDFSRWLGAVVEHLHGAQRRTDTLAVRDARRYDILLPETDVVGAAVLKQRIRSLVEQSDELLALSPDLPQTLALAAATFPGDGSQLEALEGVIETRLEADRTSLSRRCAVGEGDFSRAIERLLDQGLEPGLDPGLEQGQAGPVQLSVEATRLLLCEVARCPRERGLLFLSPSEATLPVVREGLAQLRSRETRTQIVLVADDPQCVESAEAVVCVSRARAGTDRPFAVYYSAGPVYAMVSAQRGALPDTRFFHTDDRSLVEHLAFRLHKDLGLRLGVSA